MSFQPPTSNLQPPDHRAPIRPRITSLFPYTWKQNCVHVKIRPCPNPLESASCRILSDCAPIRPCLSPLFSTLSAKHSKKRPCLNPLDSGACRPRAKRPYVNPLESHSYENLLFFRLLTAANRTGLHFDFAESIRFQEGKVGGEPLDGPPPLASIGYNQRPKCKRIGSLRRGEA